MTLTLSPNVDCPAMLDDLHERVVPGGLVASASGIVLAAALPSGGHLERLGLRVGRAEPSPPEIRSRFAAGLLDLQRLLLTQTIDRVVEHLDGRSSGGNSLLVPQQVQATLAEVAMEVQETAALPDNPASRRRAHQRLVQAGRMLLGLLGASSFLSDGPGADLHLIEVAGNVYLGAES